MQVALRGPRYALDPEWTTAVFAHVLCCNKNLLFGYLAYVEAFGHSLEHSLREWGGSMMVEVERWS